MNIYLVEWWAKERLREIRAAAGRELLAESLRPRPPFRMRLGLALIRFGQRLQGDRAGVATPVAGASAS
jgi:hypothetical protein